MPKSEAEQYYKWLEETYGYLFAQAERWKASKMPFSAKIDESSQYYQYYLSQTDPEQYKEGIRQAEKRRAGESAEATLPDYTRWYARSPETAIRTLAPQLDTSGNPIYAGDSYMERLNQWLSQLVYGNVMSESEKASYEARAYDAIMRGTNPYELPYFQDLQRPDYKDWAGWQVGEMRRYVKDETTRKAAIAKLAQGAEGDFDYLAELEGMSTPELAYMQELRDRQAGINEEEAYYKRRLGIAGQMEELRTGVPFDFEKEKAQYAEDLLASEAGGWKSRERARYETQELAEQEISGSKYSGSLRAEEALAQRKFASMMGRFTLATAENVASYAPSPATGQFYSGARGQEMANKYNQALADWNWTIARSEASMEMGAQGEEGTDTSRIVTEGGTQFYAPVASQEGGETSPSLAAKIEKGFPSLETWAGQYDWYKEFLSTPKEWRPGGGRERALAPRVRYY